METPESFRRVMELLRANDDQTWADIACHFYPRLVEGASKVLDPRVRSRTCPESAVQSTWKALIEETRKGRFEKVRDFEELEALLVTITKRKCLDRNRKHFQVCRSVERSETGELPDVASYGRDQERSREPTPEEQAAHDETLEYVLSHFSEANAEALVLRFQGYKPPEIADRLGMSLRNVHRVREEAEKILRRLERRLERSDTEV